ncbi:acyl-CoA dehydrogenase family protein [Streptomyces sp. NPDC088785]|uniref:acyl-CoA dehydrogenase family protein n=1 Tax=Streptomyces sp. NPDC088785 TaxID=3365897 RepID=UPI00382CE8BF
MAGSTHTVGAQAPPATGHDLFTTDRPLAEGVARHLAPELLAEARAELALLGRTAGSAQVREWGRLADAHPPVLRTHGRDGRRIDEVECHPSLHHLLGAGVAAGLTSAWTRPGGHVRRAAAFLVWSQVEGGRLSPLSMTHAAVPALRAQPELAAVWEPLLTSGAYDAGAGPAAGRAGALVGRGMPQGRGGGDGPADAVRARALGDGGYVLAGRQWWCGAPVADGFLVLAQAPGGPTCFLVPRVLADGGRNGLAFQRLEDAPGGRSLPSAEVEFDGTRALRVGDEGRGPHTVGGLVAASRLDQVLGAAGLMRLAVARAVHHGAYREAAGGGRLPDGPLAENVLADLALESEAATTLALRLAAAYDAPDPAERDMLRLAVPAAAYWVTGRCAPLLAEARDCLGGAGGAQQPGMPRLPHDAAPTPAGPGSGNRRALDVLRVLRGEPGAFHAFLVEIGRARGADHRLDAAVKALLTELGDLDGIEARARRLTERIALVLQGSLLVRFAPPEVADLFCATRLGGDGGAAFGTLPHTLDLGALVERARPV